MSRIEDDEIDYLKVPLECPKCGLNGWTLVTRVDRRFRCRRCRTRFYIDRLGNITPGEPAPPRIDSTRRSIDPVGAFARWWQRRSQLSKLALCLAATVVLATATYWQFRPGPSLPESLAARAAYAADAFARNNDSALRTIALPETTQLIVPWLRNFRPASWGNELGDGQFVDVEVHVLGQNFVQGTALVRARVGVLPASASRRSGMQPQNEQADNPHDAVVPAGAIDAAPIATDPDEKNLILFWKMGKSGHWLLDYSATTKNQRRT
jgi:hypothetical protein